MSLWGGQIPKSVPRNSVAFLYFIQIDNLKIMKKYAILMSKNLRVNVESLYKNV
jgi:hypothetical protein